MRFCGWCGAALSAGAAPALERRLVSVLFCDLVAFTTLSEARDPEDVHEVLGQYFSLARQVIGDYGGTIEKFIGDAVMAVWGAPLAREDDAERAVRAGLDLTGAIAGLADRLDIPALRIRVGILTGEAAVEVGRVQEGMVVGDAVNTAARIQSIADPLTVFVDDVTRLACERSIAFEPAGRHEVKGKAAPVRVWRAARVLARLGGGGRSGAVEPPLIGRDGPLHALNDALDRVRAPGAGAELVTLTGQAGIGKSRLIWEFEKHADGIAAEVEWHLGRAVSFGRGAAFSPLADIVRTRAAIAPDDPPARQREQLHGLVNELFGDQDIEGERVERALRRLLELDDGRRLIERGELFSAWRGLFAALAEQRPVVVTFEELQQADQALLEFISDLVEWARFPLLIVAVSRPDPRLAEFAPSRQIELAPLTPNEMDALVSGTVRGAPEPLIAAIRADGGGVPLYAVETLRALADRGVLAVEDASYVLRGELGEFTVAPTIRALIASRLDGLGALERRVLTGGAVIGDRFNAAAAAAVAGIDGRDAAALLAGLAAKAFLTSEGDPQAGSRSRFAFLQGAVRRVALSVLSRRERKRHHLAAAQHLLEDEGEPERAAAVAGHLLAAADIDPNAADVREIQAQARDALRAAAQRAAAVGALTDALALYDRTVQLTEDEHDRATLLEDAGLVAWRADEPDAAAQRHRAAAELHAAAGRRREELTARAQELRWLQYERSPHELLPALRELDQALAGEDDHASALAAATLSFTLYQLGENEEALSAARRGTRIAEGCGDWAELVHALAGEGSALAELQRPEEAITAYHRALDVAAEHVPRLLAILWDNVSISLASVGRYAEAAEAAGEAIGAAERASERVADRWARLALGRALCSLGDWDGAIREIESVKDDVPTIQVGMALAPLVVIALARGQDGRAAELVAEHDRRCSEAGASLFESDFRALRKTVLATDPAEAAGIVAEAEIADFAEWSGWLSPVLDKLLACERREPLDRALTALRTPDPMKQTPPVRAQVERLAGHLAARGGDRQTAEDALSRAAQLSADCALAFEHAVIELERCELGGGDPDHGLSRARDTFARLGATPWLARCDTATGARG